MSARRRSCLASGIFFEALKSLHSLRSWQLILLARRSDRITSRYGAFRSTADRRLGLVVLIAQRAQARSAQQQVSAARRVEAEPAGGEHPQEMPARKNQHVAFNGSDSAHYAVGARADLVGQFSSRTAFAEQLPVRALRVDFSRAAILILAVVPFDQVGVDFGHVP